MGLYDFLVTTYNTFLSIFPAPVQWLVTLIIIVALVMTFIGLIRHNALFIIVLIVLLPVFVPVLQRFLADIYAFFIYLLHLAGATAPQR
jgi:hypothetical protein